MRLFFIVRQELITFRTTTCRGTCSGTCRGVSHDGTLCLEGSTHCNPETSSRVTLALLGSVFQTRCPAVDKEIQSAKIALWKRYDYTYNLLDCRSMVCDVFIKDIIVSVSNLNIRI